MLVEVRDLQKSFGAVRAVDGVSFGVNAGEVYGLVGADGAGKTTTLRLLAGVLASDRGEVRIGGHDLRREPEAARAKVGYLSQRFALYQDLTVWENLRFFGEVRGVGRAELAARATALLGFVGLAGFEARLAGQLSGGMQQKLALACALLHRPQVLLLDEPTGGVDPVGRQEFWQILFRFLAEGAAVVVSTPYMDEAARCSRLALMTEGRFLMDGPPLDLLARFPWAVLECRAQPLARARAICLADPDVEDAAPFGNRLHLYARDASGPLTRLPAALSEGGARLERLRSISPTLEDLFLSLLTRAEAQHG